jgi:NAD(P)H-hydrate epimerase
MRKLAKMESLTREQVRRLDRLAIEELGIPGVVLMENAGRGCAEAILTYLREERRMKPGQSSVAVICGGGNNGGDGYVIARHLHNAGVSVTLYAAVDPGRLTGDALINATIVARMGLPMIVLEDEEDVRDMSPQWGRDQAIVDALLGTGFEGDVRPRMAAVIAKCNELRRESLVRYSDNFVVAVDVPSGLDCDTGRPSNATLRADMTVTFVAPKVGFARPEAKEWLGRLVVVGIGTPPSLAERVRKEAV